MLNIVRTNGFYFASVDAKIKDNNNNSVDLIYDFNLGERAKIQKINFIGKKIFKDNKLRNLIVSEENKPWKFITSKWGIESISEILYQIKKKKSVNGGVRAALGIKLTELNEQWHEYIKKFYY